MAKRKKVVYIMFRPYNVVAGVTEDKELADKWHNSGASRHTEKHTIGDFDEQIRERVKNPRNETE